MILPAVSCPLDLVIATAGRSRTRLGRQDASVTHASLQDLDFRVERGGDLQRRSTWFLKVGVEEGAQAVGGYG